MMMLASTAGGYSVAAGNKAPVLGASGQSPFPANGWTTIISSSQDDASQSVSLPFTWTFNSTGYTAVFPGSNTYITFGAGSTQYASLSASNPSTNKIHLASADNSWQRVSRITSGTDFVRIRYEGNSSTGGTPGSPGIVYEATFFNPSKTNNENWVEILVGVQNRTSGGISGIYGPSSRLTGGTIRAGDAPVLANTSYVLVGNSTGTSWTVYTNYYVNGTGY